LPALTISQIQPTVHAIATATEGHDENSIIAACITTAFMIQNPYTTLDQLYEAITKTSTFIAHLVNTHVTESHPEPTPISQVN
jgi:hypothetical protein